MNHQEALQKFIDLPEQERTWLLELVTLQPKITNQPPPKVNPDVLASGVQIIIGICRVLNIAPVQLKSRDRKRDIGMARFMTSHLLYQNGFIKNHIAEIFVRDHSTIIYYIEQHEDLIFSYPTYQRKYKEVIDHISMNLKRKGAAA